MFRQRSGSSLCYACGKLNRVDAPACFYCGARQPGLWGFGAALRRAVGRLDVARLIAIACIAAYVAALAIDPLAALRPRNVFDILAPSTRALAALGATGSIVWAHGDWWTVFSAIYLHGSLLHIVFNLLWVRQLARPVEELFGTARLFVIFTVAGAAGFVASNLAGVVLTIGASGAVFGLLGALVRYGRARGGTLGAAVLRQYGQWALLMFALGFFMPGINNVAHAGGFVGGYLAAWLIGSNESGRQRGIDGLFALAMLGLTALAFAMSLWTTFGG